MIEVQYKTDTAYSFHAFSLREARSEVMSAKRGMSLSPSELVFFLEGKMKQIDIAEHLDVSARYLRYIKAGQRLSGKLEGKKDKTLRSKLFNLAKLKGLKTSGSYNMGQLRAANYLDFVCESQVGDPVVDMHVLFYEHGSRSVDELKNKGLYQVLQNEMRQSITVMCSQKYGCQNLIYYARGNKHPKNKEFCAECGKELIAVDNKKLIYTVLMTKH